MSTLTSADINLKRSSTKVHAPPGGASSFSIGGAPSSPVVAKMVAEVEEIAIEPVTESIDETAVSCASVDASKATIGVAIAGTFAEIVLKDAILKALATNGTTSVVVRYVKDPIMLPYVAKSMTDNCDVVFAGTVLAGDRPESIQLMCTLQQSLVDIGVKSGKAVVPGITVQASLLEAKVTIPPMATAWAESVSDVVRLQTDAGVFDEVVTLTPPIAINHIVLNTTTSSIDDLLTILRESLASHGARGIISLGRKFRIVDDDCSNSIDFKEFIKMVHEHALDWTESQLKVVFRHFDRDNSGTISFDEFLNGCRGPLNERRTQMIFMAFQNLDKDRNGVIELNDLRGVYDASKHPDFISKKRTSDEILREFLDTFDSAVDKDGKVTVAEFIEYYKNISASIDNDDYFELMIRNAWHISGGEGWCANTTNRRVMVTHADGTQTVEEIKNDLGISDTDKDAMMANLKKQGIVDVVSIDTKGSTDGPSPIGQPESSVKTTPIKSTTTPAFDTTPASRNGRYQRGNAYSTSSSISFG